MSTEIKISEHPGRGHIYFSVDLPNGLYIREVEEIMRKAANEIRDRYILERKDKKVGV